MSNFQLPCTCGQSVSVLASQAGQTVRCPCGAMLDVPTLRGLQTLTRAEGTSAERRATWENRHRLIFSMSLISLAALILGGYLWSRMPSIRPPATAEQIKSIFATGTPEQVYEAFEHLKMGIGRPAIPGAEGEMAMDKFAVILALGIGFCGLIATMVIVISGREKAR